MNTDPPAPDTNPAPHRTTRPAPTPAPTKRAPQARTPNSYDCRANSSDPPPCGQYSNPHTPPSHAPANAPSPKPPPNKAGTPPSNAPSPPDAAYPPHPTEDTNS